MFIRRTIDMIEYKFMHDSIYLHACTSVCRSQHNNSGQTYRVFGIPPTQNKHSRKEKKNLTFQKFTSLIIVMYLHMKIHENYDEKHLITVE